MGNNPLNREASQLDLAKNSSQSPWSSLQRHPRFLGDWEDPVIRLNISHVVAETRTEKAYDLGGARIARLGAVSANGSRHYYLTEFPYLYKALKVAINNLLFSRTSKIDDSVVGLINNALRLFSWAVNANIYNLAQLVPSDVDRLKNQWLNGGWWQLLGYDEALNSVLELIKGNPNLTSQLVGTSNATSMTVNTATLNRMTGLPLAANSIPVEFVKKLGRVSTHKQVDENRKMRNLSATQATYARFMVDINRFAGFSPELGAIPFVPFIDANKIAEKTFPHARGRTRNISIDDSLKITAEGLRWLIDYSPIILDVAKAARQALEIEVSRGIMYEKDVQSAVSAAYYASIEIRKKNLPNILKMNKEELRNSISTLMIACFCLIASNHGRRRNELIGKGLPYGLYFGCIQDCSKLYENWRIDIFVEKSFNEYMSFWCNGIVRQAVACLEEISQVFRPLNTPPKIYNPNVKMARTDKLFRIRHFTKIGFEAPPSELDYARNSSSFFALAGVDMSYMTEKTQPFRRFFSCLYKYRHDIFKPGPLRQHLVHSRQSATEVYYTDAPGTPSSEGVEVRFAMGYGKELKSIEDIMAEVTSDYFIDIMLRLLRGELVGGNFAKLSIKLMGTLSKNIKFIELGNEQKAELLSTTLERQGYSISENAHGMCCATADSPTKGRSKCFRKGEIHPENASPDVCGQCLHLLTSERYRQNLGFERDHLSEQTRDFSLPAATRLQYKKDIATLDAFIQADEKVALENQLALGAVTAKWQKVFFNERS